MYSTFFVLKVCTCKISQFLDFFYLMPSILFSVFWQWNLKQRWWRYFLPFLFGQKLYLGPFLNRHKQFCKVFRFRREISQKACVSDTRKIVLLLKKKQWWWKQQKIPLHLTRTWLTSKGTIRAKMYTLEKQKNCKPF